MINDTVYSTDIIFKYFNIKSHLFPFQKVSVSVLFVVILKFLPWIVESK